jgi:hypothetical protein
MKKCASLRLHGFLKVEKVANLLNNNNIYNLHSRCTSKKQRQSYNHLIGNFITKDMRGIQDEMKFLRTHSVKV